MTICYLGLGSNLRSPERQLRLAIQHIQALPKTVLLKQSSFYFNSAVGRRGQPPFYNCVLQISTQNSPLTLLRLCLAIEKKQQRVRKVRWGARTLDIDILLYGEQTIVSRDLIIPHPRMMEREFVIKPLLQIAPNLRLPVNNKTIFRKP